MATCGVSFSFSSAHSPGTPISRLCAIIWRCRCLGSFLWDPASTAVLNDAELTNHDFLEALRNLAFTRQGKVLRPVDYKNLGAEELGGIYESLLSLTPQITADGARFTFAEFAGNERKTSGSYYTPDSLVQCLLDSALDPVVEEAIKGKTGDEAEKAILTLKVCDPAVGSGHFLVGAAHRLARHLARARALAQGESEPSPLLYQQSLRDVIGRSLYGVDLNPMAAELCRVGLWLEALEPGKPLSFLDRHIRVGNSLLGATPELIAGGLPDDAFTAVEGDDKKACAVLKKRNKAERTGLGPLFVRQDADTQAHLQQAAAALEELPDDRPDDVRVKEMAFRHHEQTEEYRYKKKIADTWCAAFVINKYFPPHQNDPRYPSSEPYGLTQGHLDGLASGRPISAELTAQVESLTYQYQFFHWHLAFPEIFARGGFDCVLGNPPWERIQPEALKFFSASHPELLKLKRSDRNKAIERLADSDPAIFSAWVERRREDLNLTKFLKGSGRFPLSTTKNINSYAVFQELALQVVSQLGFSGMVLQSGIATDEINKELFRHMVISNRLDRLLDFENRSGLFPDVDSRMRFCLLSCRGNTRTQTLRPIFAFWLCSVGELRDEERSFTLSPEQFSILAPNTGLCPTFRSRRDAELVLRLYSTIGVLVRNVEPDGNSWVISIRRLFSMAYDSRDFVAGVEPPLPTADFAPVLEAKLFHQFDHRYASYRSVGHSAFECYPLAASDHAPEVSAVPQFWAQRSEVLRRLESSDWSRSYLLGYRDITNATNERTCIACVLPESAPDDTIRILLPGWSGRHHAALIANLNSFVLDYAARNSVASTHLSEYLAKQLPVAGPRTYSEICRWTEGARLLQDWLLPRVLELSYTAWDLEAFAQDCGSNCPPFRWDEGRRFLLRCELDAAFFHLYLPAESDDGWLQAKNETAEDLARFKASFPTPRDAVAYIMETFPIVKRKDEAEWGTYRTKETIIEIYDAMAEAIRTGRPYKTLLEPHPGPPLDAAGNFIPVNQWDLLDWPSHIHRPRREQIERPEEIPLVAMVYPATDTDRAVCGAALAIVKHSQGLSSVDHLDCLLLAAHPAWCKIFLNQDEHRAFDADKNSTPNSLFVDQPINWKDCRDYLERKHAIVVQRKEKGQPISPGTNFQSLRSDLPQGLEAIAVFALKAMRRITVLRKVLPSAPPEEVKILQILEKQHGLYQLAS